MNIMKLEDKKLLIQDVMARLPYDTKFDLNGIRGSIHQVNIYTVYNTSGCTDYICSVDFFRDGNPIDIEHFKPCLFPMSSMTEEQKKKFTDKFITYHPYITGGWYNIEYCGNYHAPTPIIDWLNKHHFDYRGLIEKGLAIDATNLNIY